MLFDDEFCRHEVRSLALSVCITQAMSEIDNICEDIAIALSEEAGEDLDPRPWQKILKQNCVFNIERLKSAIARPAWQTWELPETVKMMLEKLVVPIGY